jgi:hypothetical protein
MLPAHIPTTKSMAKVSSQLLNRRNMLVEADISDFNIEMSLLNPVIYSYLPFKPISMKATVFLRV